MRVIILISILVIVSACGPEKQLARILSNNPELESVEYRLDTLRIFDTIIEGKITYRDSIVVREVRIVETPPTRYEIRYRYKADKQREKTIRDSMDAIVTAVKIKARRDVKIAKEDTKAQRSEDKTTKQVNRWAGAIKFAWAVAAIIGLVLLLFMAVRFKGSKKNGTFGTTPGAS